MVSRKIMHNHYKINCHERLVVCSISSKKYSMVKSRLPLHT